LVIASFRRPRRKEEAMAESADSLCERHREFVPLIAAVERVEASVEESRETARSETLQLHEAFAHGLIPHAVGEGRTVFPVLRRITGSTTESTEMTKEHREIARLTDELERIAGELERVGVGTSQERALRSVLHDLRTAVSDHFAEEEAVCFRILSSELGPDEARDMYETMERAAADLRRAYE
jgi:iron-sulfur cluster repair protein YtfE (RIC family)